MTQAKSIDYRALQTELDELLSELQRDDHDVDTGLKQYQRGLEIIGLLEEQLQSAQNTIRELQADRAA